MTLKVAKYVAIASFFGVTTGLVVPWLISTDRLPLPLILMGIGCVVMVWVAILDKPLRLYYKWIRRYLRERN